MTSRLEERLPPGSRADQPRVRSGRIGRRGGADASGDLDPVGGDRRPAGSTSVARGLPEVGRPGGQPGPAAGGDVDAVTGRLLSVAELREALHSARLTAAAGRDLPAHLSPGLPGPRPEVVADDPAAENSRAGRLGAPWLRQSPGTRRRAPRIRPVQIPPTDPARVPAGSRPAPAGFAGRSAVRAWSWLGQPVGPRVVVASAGGGVGATTVVAVLTGLSAAARPGGAVAVEVARRGYSPLTRLVCGAVDPVPAGSWVSPDRLDGPVSLAGLPSGPSGARVVQAGAHWWPRLTGVLGPEVAVLADLGSLEHADSRELLLGHSGPAVLVARADTAGVSAALACLTELDAAGMARRPLLVLCDSAWSRPGVLRTAARLAATAVDAVVVLPRAAVLRRSPLPVGGWDRQLSAAAAELVCALADRDDPATTGRAGPGGGLLTVLDSGVAVGGVDLVDAGAGRGSGGRV